METANSTYAAEVFGTNKFYLLCIYSLRRRHVTSITQHTHTQTLSTLKY